ncbi:MAG: tRNA (adenosine(37)-N6)-dimethylallyltransferase MiaA [Ignavibacteria bacterium GWB2_35_6b]|nr:MAG: tRNA (adenosine(37)-N6)-dimethylallyltransferase MiaA [Ignavibacteria bacterium GWB2_35_6b]
MERKVIVITGPTCSGKTYLSIKVAEKLNTEIISADSRQLYKYLNIGTAKPSHQELKKVKHHLIDCFEPDKDYSASKFENDALNIIEKIFVENKIPVVVGGSGLYIKSLVDGIFDTVDKDEEYREELLQIRKEKANEALYELLKKVDPESAEKMIPQNWKRIIRALEVYKLSGKKIGELQKEYSRENNIEFVQYALDWDRKILYENIEKRVDEMIEQGLIEETKNILAKSFDENINALNTVGYKEIISYLKNEITLERAVELIKRNTRRFAKRQMTWFRKDKRIIWLNVKSAEDLDVFAEKITKDFL